MVMTLVSQPKEITLNKFEEIVRAGDVDRVEVINKRIVNIYLKPESVGNYEDVNSNNKLTTSLDPAQYVVEIGSVEIFDDRVKELREDGYELDPKYDTRENWVSTILSWVLPLLFFVAIWLFIMRRVGGGAGGPGAQIFNIGKSRATLFDNSAKVNITFQDVAGLDEAKEEVMEVVDFLKNPKKYTSLGGKIPKGVLLVGPPGTGKTKFMLAELVQQLLFQTNEQILLLAYTNRAVDEICEAIHSFAQEDYIRIGSPYSTDPRYVDQLFSIQTEKVTTRKELSNIITEKRIFVSTVASIANRPSLLQLKKFNTAIIDEASQILEPMLVGMLPHFQRFILIGDHKQLPAVVLQEKEKSAISHPHLHQIGLSNRRNSLFERLYTQAQKWGWDWSYDMLHHQGRMHEDIAAFPSHYFYDNELLELPKELPISIWQRSPLNYTIPDNSPPLLQQLATNRMLYLESKTNPTHNPKTNLDEAALVAKIIAHFDTLYQANGKVLQATDIGVITPFRAQIAQIRHTLAQANKGYEDCTIDTVERYQGGAREIIIISLCMNTSFQMESIISLSDDNKVDRKLNVALTRARKHLVLIGNKSLMSQDERYRNLISWIQESVLSTNH